MRIAIITHKLLHNYGGALQAYALQKILRDMGHSPIGIDCMPYPMSRVRYVLSNLKTLAYKLIGRTDRNWYKFPREERNIYFRDFYDKYLTLTPVCRKYTYRVLKPINADAVIVGSDQVWRSSFHPDRNLYMNMFLKFAVKFRGLKIAYAASFGTDRWEVPAKEEKDLRWLISKFNAVSTREYSGVKLCRQYLKTDALQMCDPTILLHRSDYLRLSVPPVETDYIFLYLLDIDIVTVSTIKNIAQELGKSLLTESAENAACVSVGEWLGLIEGSAAVVTNSFHGSVFAIITHTPFMVIAHKERGEERLYDLLNLLGLSERIVENPRHIKSHMLKDIGINWKDIDSTFNKMRLIGKRFLQEALAGRNTEEITRILLQEDMVGPTE